MRGETSCYKVGRSLQHPKGDWGKYGGAVFVCRAFRPGESRGHSYLLRLGRRHQARPVLTIRRADRGPNGIR